ncbi:MAG: phospholipase D-like domain-containing protein [Alphaproteobacteria bacterium]
MKQKDKSADLSCERDKAALSTAVSQVGEEQCLYPLRTPEAHHMLLNEACQNAKKRILLFSPFIRYVKLKEYITKELLEDLSQRHVDFKIITLERPHDRSKSEEIKIFQHLHEFSMLFHNFSFLTCLNFHSKSLIVDDNLICEGSFNWLSAVNDMQHEAHNFEMSVAIKGSSATTMIHAFEETNLGKVVLWDHESNAHYSDSPTHQRVQRSYKKPPSKKIKLSELLRNE